MKRLVEPNTPMNKRKNQTHINWTMNWMPANRKKKGRVQIAAKPVISLFEHSSGSRSKGPIK
jgi:hypothetical protein